MKKTAVGKKTERRIKKKKAKASKSVSEEKMGGAL